MIKVAFETQLTIKDFALTLCKMDPSQIGWNFTII